MSSEKKISVVVASDVNPRDGIGLETYLNDKCVMEIFRDDTERRTYVTVYAESVDIDVLKASIAQFYDSGH